MGSFPSHSCCGRFIVCTRCFSLSNRRAGGIAPLSQRHPGVACTGLHPVCLPTRADTAGHGGACPGPRGGPRAVCLGSAALPLFGGHVWVGGHQFGTSSCFTTTRGDGGPQKFCNPGQTGPAMCLDGWRIQISGGGSGSCPGWGCLGVDLKWSLKCHMFYYWLLIGCFVTYCFESRFVVYSWGHGQKIGHDYGFCRTFLAFLMYFSAGCWLCACAGLPDHTASLSGVPRLAHMLRKLLGASLGADAW